MKRTVHFGSSKSGRLSTGEYHYYGWYIDIDNARAYAGCWPTQEQALREAERLYLENKRNHPRAAASRFLSLPVVDL